MGPPSYEVRRWPKRRYAAHDCPEDAITTEKRRYVIQCLKATYTASAVVKSRQYERVKQQKSKR
jgi:hypothetical protein